MSIYETNMRLLKKRLPDLWYLLDKAGSGDIEVVISKKGQPVPLVSVEQKKLAVHSKFDPEKEAERLIDGLAVEKHNLFVVIGFGFGFHVETLLKKIDKGANVLVIEKSREMLKAALLSRDLGALLDDERMLFLVDPDDDSIAEVLKGKSSKSVAFVTLRGSFQLDQEYYKNINRKVKSYLSSKEVNIATLAKFEKLWTLNSAKNALRFVATPGTNIFYDKFKGYEALVVCAGPSLHESLGFIREMSRHLVIVAVDTSYKILIDNNITPHFCLCVDPQLINARYFEGAGESSTILVADPTVHPSVFRFFNGPCVFSSMPFDSMKWVEEISGEKGEITHGGSVSTNAYDFARRLGVDTVYLAGQDLSFTDRLAHCRGSYLDELMFLQVNRFFNQEMFNRRQLTALPRIDVAAIDGGLAHTNQKMMIFKQWFEKRNDPKLVNLTSAGMRLEGISHGRLADVAVKLVDGLHPADLVQQIYEEAARSNDEIEQFEVQKKRLYKKVGLLINENSYLNEQLKKALDYSHKLKDEIEQNGKGVGDILSRLDALDEAIQSRSSSKSIVGMSVQKVIHTITEEYDLEEKPTPLQIAERSCFLYQGLLDGVSFVEKVLNKMEQC